MNLSHFVLDPPVCNLAERLPLHFVLSGLVYVDVYCVCWIKHSSSSRTLTFFFGLLPLRHFGSTLTDVSEIQSLICFNNDFEMIQSDKINNNLE